MCGTGFTMKSAGDVDFPELIPDSRALLVSVWAITTSDEQDQLWSLGRLSTTNILTYFSFPDVNS